MIHPRCCMSSDRRTFLRERWSPALPGVAAEYLSERLSPLGGPDHVDKKR
jgi:hypothetical protein